MVLDRKKEYGGGGGWFSKGRLREGIMDETLRDVKCKIGGYHGRN